MRDVPTCALTDRAATVRQRIRAAGWDACIVANEARVVLGLLDGEALTAEPSATAEQGMDPAPVTFRPDVPLYELVEHLHHADAERAWVTTSDGVLVGALLRADAERHLRATAAGPSYEPGTRTR